MLRSAPEDFTDWGSVEANITRAHQSGLLKPEEANAMLDVMHIKTLQELLLRDPTAVQLLEAVAVMTNPRPHLLDSLRKLTMSIWLDHINTLAITPKGELLVDIRDGNLWLDPRIAEERNARYRQAILRQTERQVVMDACGLFNLEGKGGRPLKVLDIGAGTCINSVMLRKRYPGAVITAVDPGVLVPKTRQLVKAHDIKYTHGEVDDVAEDNFDAILLQFVLEHDREASKAIVKAALRKLSAEGVLTIAVPNYHAFHRELETAIGKNGRDALTRLSGLDHLVGHQIIFSADELLSLVQEAMTEEGLQLPVHAKTILPRPFAFNTLVALYEQNSLWTLESAGAPEDLDEKGSVLCITVGQKPTSVLPKAPDRERASAGFRRIILAEMAQAMRREGGPDDILRMINYLRKDHRDLLDRHGIDRLVIDQPYRHIFGTLAY